MRGDVLYASELTGKPEDIANFIAALKKYGEINGVKVAIDADGPTDGPGGGVKYSLRGSAEGDVRYSLTRRDDGKIDRDQLPRLADGRINGNKIVKENSLYDFAELVSEDRGNESESNRLRFTIKLLNDTQRNIIKRNICSISNGTISDFRKRAESLLSMIPKISVNSKDKISKEELKNRLKNKSIVISDDGFVVNFSNESINKLSVAATNTFGLRGRIEEILTGSKFLYSQNSLYDSPHKERKNSYEYRNYANTILVDGEPYICRFTVVRFEDGVNASHGINISDFNVIKKSYHGVPSFPDENWAINIYDKTLDDAKLVNFLNIAKTGKQISAENRNKIYFDGGDGLVHDSEGNRYDREKLEPLAEETAEKGADNTAGGADYSLRASVDAKRDAEYEDAVKSGDLEKASRMLDDAARKAGYISTSEYRMSHRAPYKDNEGYHKSMDDVVGMYPEDVYDNDGWRHYGYGRSSNDYEAWRIITSVRNNPDAKVKVYRTVSADVKESEIRNGDWVTPVRAYAEQHRGNIGGRTRIIEQEVRAGDLYTDGNDLCEWGYDDGKPYVYKNTKNGRKLLEPTYDDNGNLIPLSKRFNQRNKDNRFSLRGDSDGGGVAERYAQASAKKEPRRIGWNEVKQAEAVSLEDFVQRQLAAGGLDQERQASTLLTQDDHPPPSETAYYG
ncbi:MAG: hypothetical protein Q4B68_01570 [Bacteroidales bacterium]|nr:hypothetical protein [Bacteroidales bacterium]